MPANDGEVPRVAGRTDAGAGRGPLGAALRDVRARIARACERVGRDDEEVGLIAISKTFPAARVAALAAEGHALFGENRVQEALAKQDDLAREHPAAAGIRWHLVGALQRNKARHVVGRFERLHGVDSIALVDEIDKRAGRIERPQAILVQVNQAGESSKAGVAPEAARAVVEHAGRARFVDCRGLTTIPPRAERPEETRRWFRELRELRDRVAEATGFGLPELSMGMSGDFEVAVEEGATWVRVGRALFGERA